MDSQMINFSIPVPMLKQIDRFAKTEMTSRSEFIRTSLRSYIKQKQEWDKIFAYGKKMANKAGVKNEDDVERIIDEVRAGV